MRVGEKLKNLRKKRGLTQTDLAEKVGKSHSTISKYEKGLRKPSIETLTSLAVVLECRVIYFFDDKFDETENK